METELTDLLSARAFLTFYYKNRGRLMLAFWLPFLLAIAISFVPSPRYKASSVLTVRMGSEYVYQPEVGSSQNTQQTTIPFDRDQIFKAEVAILESDDLHKEVIKQVGIDTLYPSTEDKDGPIAHLKESIHDIVDKLMPPDDESGGQDMALAKAAEKFDKRLDVSLEKESSVITVSFEHKNPDLAVKVLDVLLNLYMEKRKALYLEPRVELAKTHAEESRQRAVAAEKALETFKRTHNILSFESERQALIQERSNLQIQSASVSSPSLTEKLAFVEDKLNRLNKDEAQFNSLTHDATVANDEDTVFAHRLSEATAYEDLEHERAGSVRIIQPPSAPAEPKKLQMIIIIAGLVLSLLAALVTAIIIDSLSSGFSTPEQLGKTIGLPVLVVLPRRK